MPRAPDTAAAEAGTTATAPPRARRSKGTRPALRQRIGRHALLSLVLTWALGSAVVLSMGNHFVVEAFDRALLDDAHALAAHVRGSGDTEGGAAEALRLDLTPREVGMLRFDPRETIWFAVFGGDGRFVAGDRHMPFIAPPPGHVHVFANVTYGDHDLRRVSLRIDGPAPFVVVMAQTTSGRTQLLRRLLLYSGLVQLWLLVALGSWLLRDIERDLKPLADLQDAVEHRDAADLQPLPPALTHEATTSDVQRLGDAVDHLLGRLRKGLQDQREFAGTVAHELRTPLAGIRAQVEHALAQDDPAVWRSELQGIGQAEQRASRTVDQLLALARVTEGGLPLPMQTVALDALARSLLLRFLPRADERGVDLGAEGLDQPLPVRGDAGLIEGIVGNLLDNALRYGVKAAAGDGPAPQITLSLAREGGFAVLRVADNGPGLDAALVAGPAHQRWTQGAAGQQLGLGAGLGLAIVERHAAAMGGRFALAAGPGRVGAVASVWLPLAAPAAVS
ncbi:sensor histidine kinase [Paracidovorax wautersii]|uniref:histidine kinase n=1 Tax=Paracidovorax wautersii TaxID=1177982 RepID=A0A1I2G3X4_9BURK|nr:sensor histidine kinase N-terminal domain-containing protein [Paracidovorax wautersii]SFF11858.1 Signal transduction histidine kinase [Paracidovorax wautersii]